MHALLLAGASARAVFLSSFPTFLHPDRFPSRVVGLSHGLRSPFLHQLLVQVSPAKWLQEPGETIYTRNYSGLREACERPGNQVKERHDSARRIDPASTSEKTAARAGRLAKAGDNSATRAHPFA